MTVGSNASGSAPGRSQNIKIEREGRVLHVIFDRPEKKNALTSAMYCAATQALAEAEGDGSIGAVVFSGSGAAFCAGNDIGDFLDAGADLENFPAFVFIKALAGFEKPLVAAVEGIAVGIGATMILHCDLVYVSPGAVFRMPFVDLGLVPEAASSLLLPRRIGLAKASEILLLGAPLGADEAVRLGLANEVVAAGKIKAFATEQAARLAAKPRAALAAARRLIRGNRDEILARIEEEAQLFAIALQSEEARAAFSAFLMKSSF
ncbi:enoyl-CoA hydratase-related protein [Methylocapsa acidiphila]|uniref:enoyl-CoA hydratase-related protein n=1 Tax=Methylocapsa acidiphila TaxID=133552 RepID=UPI000402E5DB|nr:enoyl-CoA hydratase-related protein [Methylocapsa acidiphila]